MTKLLEALFEAYKLTLSFADNVVSKFDDEKFAQAVNDLYGRPPELPELDAAIPDLANASMGYMKPVDQIDPETIIDIQMKETKE